VVIGNLDKAAVSLVLCFSFFFRDVLSRMGIDGSLHAIKYSRSLPCLEFTSRGLGLEFNGQKPSFFRVFFD